MITDAREIYQEHEKDAFWSKSEIVTSGCWEWRGALSTNGYGNVRIHGRYTKAHVLAWELAFFPVPPGFQVCHACDNRKCINPDHLMLGSAKANSTDMITKCRGGFHKNRAIGTRNFNAKLTWGQVCEIRELYKQKLLTQTQLAKTYGVTQSCIGAIVRNEVRTEA